MAVLVHLLPVQPESISIQLHLVITQVFSIIERNESWPDKQREVVSTVQKSRWECSTKSEHNLSAIARQIRKIFFSSVISVKFMYLRFTGKFFASLWPESQVLNFLGKFHQIFYALSSRVCLRHYSTSVRFSVSSKARISEFPVFGLHFCVCATVRMCNNQNCFSMEDKYFPCRLEVFFFWHRFIDLVSFLSWLDDNLFFVAPHKYRM